MAIEWNNKLQSKVYDESARLDELYKQDKDAFDNYLAAKQSYAPNRSTFEQINAHDIFTKELENKYGEDLYKVINRIPDEWVEKNIPKGEILKWNYTSGFQTDEGQDFFHNKWAKQERPLREKKYLNWLMNRGK